MRIGGAIEGALLPSLHLISWRTWEKFSGLWLPAAPQEPEGVRSGGIEMVVLQTSPRATYQLYCALLLFLVCVWENGLPPS